jgi:flagellar hook-associated protein 3 FlgL
MMRITTLNSFQTSVDNLQKRQQDLSDAQNRLTSGKRVQVASDDPVAAAQAERALAAMRKSESDQRALDVSQNVMTQTEAALGNAGDLLQQARGLVVNAGNGSYSDGDRAALAQQLQALRDQMLTVANSTDGAGTYLFGGQGSNVAPFVDGAGGVGYVGTAGSNSVPSTQSLPTSTDGQSIWLQAPNPASGQPALSAFDVLDKAITALKTPGQNSTQIQQTVTTALNGIDAVAGNLLAARSAAGAVLNRMDTMTNQISADKLAAQTAQSNATDLDMVQAISDFQNQQTGYDAALKTYGSLQKLSLFQYISV